MRRRKLLTLGAMSVAILAVGGGLVATLQPGLREARLSTAGREVFAGAARALLEGSLPSNGLALKQALGSLLERIEGLIVGLAPHAQSELSQLLALLANAGGRRALTGLADPWTLASTADIQQALQDMRVSGISLRQQAYQALHDIVGSAYFSDPRTWDLLGYPGPLKI